MSARRLFLIAAAMAVGCSARADDFFESLTVGIETYSNVTVTTKTRTDVFISHARGIANLKVRDLDEAAQLKLGYELPKPVEPLKKRLALPKSLSLDPVQMREMEEKLTGEARERLKTVGPAMIAAVAGVLLALHLLFCYLCRLVCIKANSPPGVLIWIPIAQLLPLLRAAGMSPVWMVAMFLPLLNLVGAIVWAHNISKARGKGVWTTVGLCLPVFNIVAFLYLALSDSLPEAEGPGKKLVTFHPPDRRAAI